MRKAFDDAPPGDAQPAQERELRSGRLSRMAEPGEAERRPIDQHLERISILMDRAIKVPGTDIRFGLDPIIGFLFPAAGDVITTMLSAYIVLGSIRYGLPKIVIARMVFNVAVDYLVGTIPFLGDLFDFAWKANQRNLQLLSEHAAGERRSTLSDWLWVIVLLGGLAVFVLGLITLVYYAFKAAGFSWL